MDRLRYFLYLCFIGGFLFSCSSDEVEPEIGQGRIYGCVIDASTNEPVAGVLITLYPGGDTSYLAPMGHMNLRIFLLAVIYYRFLKRITILM